MEWRTKLVIMKKIFFFLIIFVSSCMESNLKTLEQQKKFFINDFIERDSELIKQAKESGLYEKMKNASSTDSLTYYYRQFHLYNDSINSLKK